MIKKIFYVKVILSFRNDSYFLNGFHNFEKIFLMDIVHKSWKITTPPLKKLLSRTITHLLSRHLNKNKFEVVFEGFLDSINSSSEQPDVVIYSNQDKLIPVVAIEICKSEEIIEMVLLAREIVKTYSLKEFFIFDYEASQWHLVDQTDDVRIGSFSQMLSVDLKRMVNLFPFDDILNKNQLTKIS